MDEAVGDLDPVGIIRHPWLVGCNITRCQSTHKGRLATAVDCRR
jgi:hypothetical protein